MEKSLDDGESNWMRAKCLSLFLTAYICVCIYVFIFIYTHKERKRERNHFSLFAPTRLTCLVVELFQTGRVLMTYTHTHSADIVCLSTRDCVAMGNLPGWLSSTVDLT